MAVDYAHAGERAYGRGEVERGGDEMGKVAEKREQASVSSQLAIRQVIKGESSSPCLVARSDEVREEREEKGK